MTKTQKRLDQKLRKALTDVCELLLEQNIGFEWLTHQADYTNFPASLLITCVFTTEADAANADQAGIMRLLQAKLLAFGVKFKAIKQQVLFDSEEACAQQEGHWDQRLAKRVGRAVSRNRP